MKNWFDGFKIAWAMLTAIPVFKSFEFGTNAGRSVAFYPLVGLLLGLIMWGLSVPVNYLLPETISSIALFAIYTLMYGALHTDGFIDTVDALISYKSPEEMVQIMKDPHVGAQGSVYLILFMLMKAALFTAVDPCTFVVVPLLSRYSAVMAMSHFPYLSSGSMARVQNEFLHKKHLIIASITLLISVAFLGMNTLFLLPIAILWPLAVGSKLNKKLGGLNGDTYGFLIETCELLLLLTLVILFK